MSRNSQSSALFGSSRTFRVFLACALSLSLAAAWVSDLSAQTIRTGFDANSLAANDDNSTGLVPFGFDIDFFGIMRSGGFVNNNGNLTLDTPLSSFTAFDLTSTGQEIIAPFFADVDTRAVPTNGSKVVTYGTGMVSGRNAFGANWIDVGYFSTQTDKLNSFQLIIVERSDTGAGNFDLEFNYGTINWETGSASGGTGGLGGSSARAGYSNGSGDPGTFFEFPGSAVNGALLDDGPNSLTAGSSNGVLGRYIFYGRGGQIEITTVTVIDNVLNIGLDFNTASNWTSVNPNEPTIHLLPGTDNETGTTLVNNIIQDGVSAALSSSFTAANSFDNLIVRGGASLGIGFDLSGMTNFVLGDGSTSGTVSQTAGTVSVDTLEVGAGSTYTISGGAFTSTSDATLDGGIFTQSGNTAMVSVGGNLDLINGATLAYVLGTDGVIPTAVTGGFSTDMTSGITVDGGAFIPAGEFTTIDLLTASGVTGFDPDNNFAFSNFGALVPQVVIDGGVSLTVINPVPQLFNSAVPMNLALGQLGSELHHQAVRGINSRLFRARGRTTSGGNGTTQTTGDTLETGGRELPASRTYRNGGELRMETSINLDGTTRRTANSTEGDEFETATLHDDAPFLSVERPAGASLDPGVLASGDKWMIYSAANFGNVGLDNLGGNPGFDSYTYSSTLGFEYQVSDALALGLGWSHVWNDNTMNGGLGSADLEGDAAIAYATYFKNNFWADLLYSYGSYEADLRRIAGGGTSVASPDLEAHLLSLNLGYNIEGDFTGTRLAQLTEGENRLVHGPTLGIDYSTGTLDGYTETGNFPFDAAFADQDYESLVTTIGWQATLTQVKSWGQLRPQFRLGYGREHLDQDTSVTGSLAANPLVTATGTDISPGENWMEVGAGVAFQFNNTNLTVYLDYTGQYFRADAEIHYATLGAKLAF